MSKTSSFVEVNGNRYDAITGELISRVKRASTITRPSGKKMVDGFVLSSPQKSSSPKKKATAEHPKVVSAGLHAGHQKSKTLMRRVVKKPATLKMLSSEQSHARSAKVDHLRQSRAVTAGRHASVSRFGFFPNSNDDDANGRLVAASKPTLKVKRAMQSEAPAPRVPSMVTSVSHQKLEKMLDEALVKASAHKQMMRSNRHSKFSRLNRVSRRLRVTIAIAVAVALTIFLVWQNLPSVAVRVAAARAHVKASIPAYTPNGYSFAKTIEYKPGSLTMKYIDKSHASEGFSLTQKSSNWSSSSLAANALPRDVAVQASEVNGTTVYIYGEANDATWVNHGVLYSLENKANLSSDQVMKIVGSL